jgi:hypothetical protein
MKGPGPRLGLLDEFISLDDLPQLKPASPEEIGQAHENQAEHVQQPNPRPSTEPEHEAVSPPSLNQGSPKDSDPTCARTTHCAPLFVCRTLQYYAVLY